MRYILFMTVLKIQVLFKIKPAAHDACFPVRFSKLLEILPSVWCNFSNLLKRKQSSRKTSIVYRWLYIRMEQCA